MDAVLLVSSQKLSKMSESAKKFVRDLDRKGSGIHLGVIKGHFYIQVPEVAAAEALRDAQRVAMRVPHAHPARSCR